MIYKFLILFAFSLLVTCCDNNKYNEQKKDPLCFKLKADSNTGQLIEFGEKFIGKENYWDLYERVTDSISSWHLTGTSTIDKVDSETIRFWGIDSVLFFNAEKNRLQCYVYYAIKQNMDSLNKHIQRLKKYESSEKQKTKYFNQEIDAEPPPYLQDFQINTFDFQWNIKNNEIHLLQVLNGANYGVEHNLKNKKQVISILHNEVYKPLNKQGDFFCMPEYYRKLTGMNQ